MSVVARLEVISTREGSMSEAVASAVEALDRFDVSYETTPTDTVVEADDASEVFAAAEAAHRAVDDDRVITSLEVDDQRTRTQRRRDRVASVERKLGRPAKRERRFSTDRSGGPAATESDRGVAGESGRRSGGETAAGSAGETDRYGGPWRESAVEQTASSESWSRYLRPRRPVSR